MRLKGAERSLPLVAAFITVRKVARSRNFYSRILGGTVVMEENPSCVPLSISWIIMNPGGPPTPDRPDIDRGAEVRCYLRDPDGYLIEVGQSTGLMHGQHAAKRPEDLLG
jgi:hypothetical protein